MQLTYITAHPSVCDSGISTSRLASCLWGRAAGVGGILKGSEGMSECQQKKLFLNNYNRTNHFYPENEQTQRK